MMSNCSIISEEETELGKCYNERKEGDDTARSGAMTLADLKSVLARRPLGLVFDIDGTLSPIAQISDEARLYPGVAQLLEEAQRHEGVHVGIITGRGLENGAAMVNVDGLTYIGIHGLEWSDGLPETHEVEVVPEALAYRKAGTALLDLVERHLDELAGIYLQRKRVGGTVHYRMAPNPEQVRARLLSLLEEPARQLNMRLTEGKLAVEIRVPLDIDVGKGGALRRFVQRFGLHSVVFAGDDRTDLDAVLEIPHLRQQGVAALSIVVQHADTLPELLTHADIVVQGVEEMAALLRQMVETL
jgi:trehalose 6-phosphate phosphatase